MKRKKGKSKGGNEVEGLFKKIKEGIKRNVFLQALPYAILISSLTIVGLFGGYSIGKGLGGGIAGFILSLSFSFLGFFVGLFISYLIVKTKYPIKV